jgi:hypothetical protein
LEGKQIIYPPPTLPPLILRERPPPRPDAPTHHETCIVYLVPPTPPRTVVTHICKIPPKPRDIIIERWLPYKFERSKKVYVKRAIPPREPELHNINIIYESQVNIKHQIHEHGPIPTDPETYTQQFGDQLLSVKDLYDQLFAELEKQRADDNTRQRLQHMCRGPLDPNPGPCNNGGNFNIPPVDSTFHPRYVIDNIPNRNPCEDILGITAY